MTSESQEKLLGALRQGAGAIEVPIDDSQQTALLAYADLLLAYNTHTNLTRIVEPEAIAVKHFVDSLTVFRAVPDLSTNARVGDVGTGAGFPGLVLRIARPDIRLVLIDSLQKRLTFLAQVIDALKLENVTLIHARAEDVGREPAHRDRYDLVTARAVAALPTLIEWCGPLARVGGRFVAMKSGGVDAELQLADRAARELEMSLAADVRIVLPALVDEDNEAAERRLIVYRKLRPTPNLYPRRAAEIKVRPLG